MNQLLTRWIPLFGQVDLKRQDAVDGIARVNPQESMKAEKQEAGAHQKNESHRDFRNDEPLSQSGTTGYGPAPGFL
jgi:hypothetical protein